MTQMELHEVQFIDDARMVSEPLPPPSIDCYSLNDCRIELLENLREGMDCPCCGRFTKCYKYKLHSTMARGLIWLANMSDGGRAWTNIQTGPKWLLRSKTLTTAKHWDLIEPKRDPVDDKRSSGHWRLTQHGLDFVYNEIEIPMHAYLYDNRLIAMSNEVTDIVECLGNKFDYHELMNS